ncbi:hypothetical protein F5141DRAFT_1128825 [Pisolithus sp. B1]|nr:hypothetical protein F5141DRAFT_1128825 [Pisolithus sp. B1]
MAFLRRTKIPLRFTGSTPGKSVPRRARWLVTHSYVDGPTDPPLEHRTFPVYFREEIVGNYAERRALISRHEQFSRHIDATARGLTSLGVKKGDRVGVVMGNNSAYALLQWACSSVGAILVTLNPAYRLPELVEALSVAGVSHLFVVPRIRASQYIRGLSTICPDRREYLEEIGDTKCAIDFREMLVWLKELVDSHHSDEVINLQFTSGTTGKPKAVSLTHLNLLNNGLSISRCMRLTADDILCNLAAWSHGACVVYPSPVFHPEAIVDAVVQERCTALHGVPTHFLGVLSEVQKRREAGEKLDLSCLRTGIAAGSPVPIDLMDQLINKLNLVDITIAYGMTLVDSVNSPRVETVGRVQPHIKAKVIDRVGEVVPVGTPGEICVTGYLLQKGYWENEEQTRKVMRADPKDPSIVWMYTGDEGIMDEDGYLRVPDTVYGEVVGVWIVLEPGTTMTREEVRKVVSDEMNPQNSPAWVWFIGEPGTAKEFPKTASGKVMKHVLRAWSKELARDNVGKISK